MSGFAKKVYPALNLDSRNRFRLSGDNIRNASPAPSRQLNLGDTRNSPNFSDGVYGVVKRVSCGRVVTYKDIAVAIGSPYSVRAVGNALHKNRSLRIPCHRVVRSDGNVGGYVYGTKRKIKILQEEKIKITKGKVDKRFMINPALDRRALNSAASTANYFGNPAVKS